MSHRLPWWIDWLEALAMPVIAILALGVAVLALAIAYGHLLTTRQKTAADMFGRRMEKYVAIKDVLEKVMVARSDAPELYYQFRRAMYGAESLFDNDVGRHLEKISNAMHHQKRITEKMQGMPRGKERLALAEEFADYSMVMLDAYIEFEGQAERYIQFPHKRNWTRNLVLTMRKRLSLLGRRG